MGETNNGFGFGAEGLWLFAILALMWGGGGFMGGGNAGRAATVEDLNNSANFTRLESQVMNNGNRIEAKADAVTNGLSTVAYEMAQQFGNTNMAIQNCCCQTQRAIDGVNYNGALNTAGINATVTAQTQKVLDALAADKIDRQAQRINQLERELSMTGVVRYPSTFAYNAGSNPFCAGSTGCGCGGYAYGAGFVA